MEVRTIYFWGPPDGYEVAKKLAREDRQRKSGAYTRDASVYDGPEMERGEFERAERIVLLPSVHPYHAARLRKMYEQAGIKVIVQTTEAIEQAEKERKKTPPDLLEKLRRLPTGQIREYAREHGIDVTTARDRTAMIAAILDGQQESIPQ